MCYNFFGDIMNIRTNTKAVKIGNLYIGGQNKIIIQSMTNTKTKDINATVLQIKALEEVGCEIIRVAVFDMDDANAISKIKEQINIPIVADIHFDPNLAIAAIKAGADKIRLNPGNIKNKQKISEIVSLCKERSIPIRIGVNSGSLPDGMEPTAQNMIKAAKMHISILEELEFYNIVLSLKASSIDLSYEAYLLASKEFSYPLHVGITEAGTTLKGVIKSTIGLTKILSLGIGDTIRVSLTDDPVNEVIAAKEILLGLHLKDNVPTFTSCPTCGRCQYDMIPIANEIEKYLNKINANIHVAVMGCAVNGPGEAREADLGVAGGNGEAILFKKGQIIRKIKEADVVSEMIKEIDLLINN